ncbi:mechanosensitive ion channel family protein [Alcaligenes faecalis]|uniref:mechanosensitive ion channel family protein n=1 Tax=Alcaligenes faecalis TaxID=511 RepID=UPI000E19E086|nr:mechanosensitive ion channel family protein [Alcaligenes faecalis]SSY79345.1 Mechanosensitive ion channel [Alcaligenes faecalis subsp. faecalis]
MMSMTWWMWLLLLLGGWAILLLVHFLGGKIIERLASPVHFLRFFSERIRWPSRLFFLAVFLRICIPLAPISAKWQSYLIVGDMLVLIICTTWMLMSAVESLFQLVVVRHPLNVSDNLRSRQIYTQARVLARSVHFSLVLLGLSFALMVLPGARQLGTSLLASAGVAGLVAGIAARPVLGNFIAGLQIAFTQPIRIDDVVIVEGEWGPDRGNHGHLCGGTCVGRAPSDRSLAMVCRNCLPELDPSQRLLAGHGISMGGLQG